MRFLTALAVAAPLAAAILPARAAPPPQAAAQPGPGQQDHPPLLPKREASVLYRVTTSNGPPTEVRITSQPNGAAMRIDMPDHTYMLLDPVRKTMAMVAPTELMVMDLPWQPEAQEQFLLNSRMRFTRRGPETVAGVRCTAWDVVLDGNRGTVCVTDDGVLLRSVTFDPRGRRNMIEAVSVSMTPAAPADYLPPEGFDHMDGPGPGGAVQ